MTSTHKWIIGLVVAVVIIAVAGYYWHAMKAAKAPQPTGTVATETPEGDSIVVLPSSAVSDAAAGGYICIYGFDGERWVEKTVSYISAPEHMPLSEKVAVLADRLSRTQFGALPIEVLSITEHKGKRIARINLRENADRMHGRGSWRGVHFQGSAGGEVTTLLLKKSFLQPAYTGEWIDGAEFYYEGKPIRGGEWDHIFLDGIFLRDGTQIPGGIVN